MTLADVRSLLEHLPAAHRENATWRYVADRLDDAARGADVFDLVVPLRMVLSMEGITCRPK
jgi:hypothetical protein